MVPADLTVYKTVFGIYGFCMALTVNNYHRHHCHHVAVKELGHLLTRSGLTHPEVSSVIFFGSFYFLG
jgi:hypothetical protein